MVRQYMHHIAILLALLSITVGCALVQPHGEPSPEAFVELVQRVKPAVVTVVTFDASDTLSRIGSGFFINRDNGILVTNYHVLKGAYRAEIETGDNRRYPIVAVVAENRYEDLVKLKVDIPPEKIRALPLRYSEPSIGERVLVIGSPLGFEQTVSDGIVSAIRKKTPGGELFQFTAPISQGSSGGPVIDREGRVIGVVTFQTTTGQNLNFATAISALLKLTDMKSPPALAEWALATDRESSAAAAELCRRGAELSIRGKNREALGFFREATRENPKDPAAWYGLGSCYIGLDKPEQAIAAYKKPVEADPNDVDARFILATYYQLLKRYDDAIAALKEIVKRKPDHVPAYIALGEIYDDQGRWEDARIAYERVLSLKPDYAPAMNRLAIVYAKMGLFEKALSQFHRYLRLDPQSAEAYFNMGVVYGHLNRTSNEIESYKNAIRNDPKYVPAHFNLGVVYLDTGRKKDALDEYAILKSLDPKTADRLFDRLFSK